MEKGNSWDRLRKKNIIGQEIKVEKSEQGKVLRDSCLLSFLGAPFILPCLKSDGRETQSQSKTIFLPGSSFLVGVKEAWGPEHRAKQTRGHAIGKQVCRKAPEEQCLQPDPKRFWDVWIFTHVLTIMLKEEIISQALWVASELKVFPETWSIIWRQNHKLCLSNARLFHSPLPLTHTLPYAKSSWPKKVFILQNPGLKLRSLWSIPDFSRQSEVILFAVFPEYFIHIFFFYISFFYY